MPIDYAIESSGGLYDIYNMTDKKKIEELNESLLIVDEKNNNCSLCDIEVEDLPVLFRVTLVYRRRRHSILQER